MRNSVKQDNTTWLSLFNGWQNNPLDTAQQLDRILSAGLEFLGLDVAILSHVENKVYTVENFVGGGLTKGQQFSLGDTYCAITTKKQEIVAIHHMKMSEYFRHPCYEAFKLETYIGVPTILNGSLYGTVNFSSSTPREEPFTIEQQRFVQLIGESVNWALMARNQ